MRLSRDRIRNLCRDRDLRLKDLLARAKVSRTAYYSLLHKDSVLPRSIVHLAEYLEVSPTAFLDDENSKVRDIRQLQEEAADICRRHPDCDADNIRHTLLLLREAPVDRLQRGLIRAQRLDLHR